MGPVLPVAPCDVGTQVVDGVGSSAAPARAGRRGERSGDAMGYSAPGRDRLERVAAAAAGDRAAMESVLGAIRPVVVSYCRAELGGELGTSAADAVAHEACRFIVVALRERVRSDQPLLSVVWAVTCRCVARARLGDEVVDPTTPAPRSEAVTTSRMQELLPMLPTRERAVLILRLICGLTPDETAIALGAAPGAVRRDQHVALEKLRKMMTGSDAGPGR